ncbi:MAG: Hin recombinase, partial [Lachnospiraceae bacterium]|nr:Hin recombinase [Lachnospiraceae bacterium]
MGNERKAGRKRRFDPDTIKRILESYDQGQSVSELAGQYGVSRQTMSFYVNDVAFEMEIESRDDHFFPIRGISYWNRLNRVFGIPKEELKDYSLRLDYMREEEVYSSILANYKDERILVKNFSEHPMKCAFGVKRNPTWG